MGRRWPDDSLQAFCCSPPAGQGRHRRRAQRAAARPMPRPRFSPAAASGRPSATSRRCRGWSRRSRASPAGAPPTRPTSRSVRAAPAISRRCEVTFDPARISYRRARPPLPAGDRSRPIPAASSATAAPITGPRSSHSIRPSAATRWRRGPRRTGYCAGRVVTPVRGAGALLRRPRPITRTMPAETRATTAAYRRGCGKDARLRVVWGAQGAALGALTVKHLLPRGEGRVEAGAASIGESSDPVGAPAPQPSPRERGSLA